MESSFRVLCGILLLSVVAAEAPIHGKGFGISHGPVVVNTVVGGHKGLGLGGSVISHGVDGLYRAPGLHHGPVGGLYDENIVIGGHKGGIAPVYGLYPHEYVTGIQSAYLVKSDLFLPGLHGPGIPHAPAVFHKGAHFGGRSIVGPPSVVVGKGPIIRAGPIGGGHIGGGFGGPIGGGHIGGGFGGPIGGGHIGGGFGGPIGGGHIGGGFGGSILGGHRVVGPAVGHFGKGGVIGGGPILGGHTVVGPTIAHGKGSFVGGLGGPVVQGLAGPAVTGSVIGGGFGGNPGDVIIDGHINSVSVVDSPADFIVGGGFGGAPIRTSYGVPL